MPSKNPLKNKSIVVTAGPTREYWDPVRFLSNPSSGAMGIAIAEQLSAAGARVSLVLGPTSLRPSKKISVVPVVSALDMRRAVLKKMSKAHALVATAAVSDWRFSSMKNQKIKKGNAPTQTIRLIRNPDILAEVGRARKKKSWPLLVGFSLETTNLKNFALKKMMNKNLDLIIANQPETFGSGKIRGLWIERPALVRLFPSMTKKNLASHLTLWLKKKLTPSSN